MYNPNEVEESILKFWEKNKIFEKLREKNKGKKIFSFIDGPITANNPMGVHHAWGRTYKDLYQRFKAMQGFDQRFQNGFDCQGLHVEIGVEKALGLNSKRDIEKLGLEKFSLECRKSVEKFSKIQTNQSIRLGQWMDWSNSYYTMDDYNIEMIWYFLSKCKEKKWLYKGTRVMPWCYRCGTSLSQHELMDSYKEKTHISLYLKFPLKNKPHEYFLVWTTTPWTLTSNVAVAVHPDLNYVKIKQKNNIYYLSQGSVNCLTDDYEILETFKGKKLIGLEYYSIFNELEPQKKIKHSVLGWDAVSEEEGTGLVHIAPGCGAEDNEIGKKEGLVEICPIDENGYFTKDFGFLAGKNVKNSAKLVINDLEKRGFIYKIQDYTHRYPCCWRCDEELVFRLVSEWFISSNEIRPLMIKEARKVKWYPPYVLKLMENWLENMGDWCISRKRYWGLPLPIWQCKNNHQEFIVNRKELEKKAISGIEQLKELHRPWIDNVILKCPKCNEKMYRIKEVGDCWLDAGIVPFSTLKYLDDKNYWKKWSPAELVIEMREQVRLWFYSMLFMSVTLENRTPYLKVLAYEKLNDEMGRPMHKSAGNTIWFDEAVEKMGSDVMRWLYTSQNPQFNLNFGYKGANDIKRTLTLLINIGSYLESVKADGKKKPSKLNIEDRWLNSKLNSLIKEVTLNLEELKPHLASKAIEDFFIATLSRTYIQLVRDRVQGSKGENKDAALYMIYNSVNNLLKLMAPFTPFLTEHLYQKYLRNNEKIESIHLFDWPTYNEKLIDKELEADFDIISKIIQAILSEREKSGLGIRWPLKEVVIVSKEKDLKNIVKDLKEIIKNQTNVKEVLVKDSFDKAQTKFESFKLYLDTKLTPELEKEGYTRELIRRIQALRKKAGLKKQDRINLYIHSDYSLKDQDSNIKEITGSKTLIFGKPKKKYAYSSKEQIKSKNFEFGFDIVK